MEYSSASRPSFVISLIISGTCHIHALTFHPPNEKKNTHTHSYLIPIENIFRTCTLSGASSWLSWLSCALVRTLTSSVLRFNLHVRLTLTLCAVWRHRQQQHRGGGNGNGGWKRVDLCARYPECRSVWERRSYLMLWKAFSRQQVYDASSRGALRSHQLYMHKVCVNKRVTKRRLFSARFAPCVGRKGTKLATVQTNKQSKRKNCKRSETECFWPFDFTIHHSSFTFQIKTCLAFYNHPAFYFLFFA